MGNCNTKRKFLTIYAIVRSSIIAVICLFAIAACSSEIDTPVSEEERVRSYLCITLVMPQTTRATDNDTEPGLDVENQISNLTVFFFKDNKQGVGGEAKTEFFKKVYVDHGFKRTNNGVEVEVPLSDYTPINSDKLLPGSRIAVVANMGDLRSLSTRGALQQHKPEKTWQEGDTPGSPSGCSKFTMASAKNDDGIISKAPEAEQPKNGDVYYKASVTVERTAARIDLCYTPSQEHAPSQEGEEGYIEYTSGGNGSVRLYGLSPINAMQQPSYALKRISEGFSEDYTCFNTYHYTGDLPEAGNPSRPTAYVIEPHTAEKTADATPPTEWYGSTSATNLSKSQWEDGKNLAALLGDKDIKLELDNGQRSLIVTYTNENTQHYTQHSEKWLTGLLLRTVFVPTTVYTDGNATMEKEDYKAGETFWCCRYKGHNANELYFATLEAAEAYLEAHPATSAEILVFPSGRCFYHTWIRHTVEERDPAIIFPMEYGIVRNHIYRVSFTFHRAGNPTPDIENPQNVEAVIYVRPWNVFKHEQIIL